MSSYSSKLRGFDAPTVWHEFSGLANKHKAVNLGQGFPDWQCPEFAKTACIDAINGDHNQYSRSAGEVFLVNAISDQYSPLFGRKIEPLTEITVTVGATEALFSTMMSFLEVGDEVVVLEPAFDVYPAHVQMVGGVCVYVPLLPPPPGSTEWTFDVSEIEKAISPKTRILLLNTPHNPSGKVFTITELQAIAEIISRYPRVLVVTDEVYEHLIYDNNKHTRLATIPGMWDRMLTISSAGKTFSITGWKVGWVIGPKHLIQPLTFVNQYTRFCVSTPCQHAIGTMLGIANEPYGDSSSYYEYLRTLLQGRRDRLVEIVTSVGLKPMHTEGGYFLNCDTSGVEVPEEYLRQTDETTGATITRDRAFCRWLTIEVGVAAIPLSAFYTADRAHLVSHLVRLCLCKEEATIEEAGVRLRKLLPASGPVVPPEPPLNV